MRTRFRRPDGAQEIDGIASDEVHRVSVALLRLASLAQRRPDFLQQVAALLLELSGCDLVEIWERRGARCYRGTLTRDGAQRFQFDVCSCSPDRTTGRHRRAGVLRAPCHAILGHERAAMDALVKGGFGRVEAHADGDARAWLLRRKRRRGDLPQCVLLGAFTCDQDSRGLMLLGYRDPERPTGGAGPLFVTLAQTVGVALAERRTQATLRERVKELVCTYGVSQIAGQPGLSLDEQLQAVVELVPPAWQYPEIASACIILDGRAHPSRAWQEGPHRQRGDIVTAGERRGFIEVVYSREMPPSDEGPFLAEERSLLNSIARQVALMVERRQASEDGAKLEEQLRHAERLATIGALSAGVAHELNEPLGAILGFAQLMHKAPRLAEETRRDLAKIVDAALHAREIVKKLMLFARQTPPQKGPLDLNKLVSDGLIFLESRCAREGIEVRRVLAPRLPAITADASQLQQVLVNLVVNAVQAMQGGGTLTIRTAASERHVSLVVEDTGVGMSDEVRQRVFLPFFTTKPVGKGTGLGLSVVHGIVQAHGGVVRVESRPRAGSRFTVELPRRHGARPRRAPKGTG